MVKLTRLAVVPAAFALLSSAQPVAAGIAINGQVVNPVTSSSSTSSAPAGSTATGDNKQATARDVLTGVAAQAAATLPEAAK